MKMWCPSRIHTWASSFHFIYERYLLYVKAILFADDTTCFYSHKDVKTLCETVNSELKEVCNWFKANKLSLNAKKTNLVFLGTRFQTKNIDDRFDIYLDGCKPSRVEDAKLLQ